MWSRSPAFFQSEVREGGMLWERWVRCLMGIKTSPHQSLQAILWMCKIILGDRLDAQNAFCWHHVRLNLPGLIDYDASIAWVSNVRTDDWLASDLLIYVDDL